MDMQQELGDQFLCIRGKMWIDGPHQTLFLGPKSIIIMQFDPEWSRRHSLRRLLRKRNPTVTGK